MIKNTEAKFVGNSARGNKSPNPLYQGGAIKSP